MDKDKAVRSSKVLCYPLFMSLFVDSPFSVVPQEGIMSSLFRSSSGKPQTLVEEMTTTMSTLLEDTLLKNIQLKVFLQCHQFPYVFVLRAGVLFCMWRQTDIETLGDEVARLTAEKAALIQRLHGSERRPPAAEDGDDPEREPDQP